MSDDAAHDVAASEGFVPDQQQQQQQYAYGMPYQAQMQFAAPPYGMPAIMYPPHMMGYPPHMMGMPPVQMMHAHQDNVEEQLARKEHEEIATKEKEANEGDKSWAQIARDPTQEKGDAKAPQELEEANQYQRRASSDGQLRNQQHGNTGNNVGKEWSKMVKTSVEYFKNAQQYAQIWLQNLGQFDPFQYMAVACNVPQKAFDLVMNNQPLSPEYEVWAHFEAMVRHLRTILSAPMYLAEVNPAYPLAPRPRQFFVLQCENEMEVFHFIRRSMWTVNSDESANMLDTSFGQLAGIGQVIVIFAIPQLRKLVGCAEVTSQTVPMDPEAPQGERVVHLQWIYIRDIPIAFLKDYDCLSNPAIVKERQAKASGGKEKETAEEGDSKESAEAEGAEAKGEDAAGEEDPADDAAAGESEANGRDSAYRGGKMIQEGPKFYQVGDYEGAGAFETMGGRNVNLNGGILLDFAEYAAADEQKRAPDMSKLICGGPRQRSTNASGMQNSLGNSRGGRGGGRGGMNRFSGAPRAASNNTRGRGGYSGNRGGSSYRPGQQDAGVDHPNEAAHKEGRRDDGQERRGGAGTGGRGRGGNLPRVPRGDDRRDRQAGSSQSTLEVRDMAGRGGRGGARTAQPSRKLEGAEGVATLRSQYTFEIQTKKGKQPPRKAGADGAGQAAPALATLEGPSSE